MTALANHLTVDALAQEIRRVDGNHSLGAGALAEALMPFLATLSPAELGGVGWLRTKPTEPGIYRVRGWEIGRRSKVAVVSVAEYDGSLRCNLHECNSETDVDEWSRLEDFSDAFEWQRVDFTPRDDEAGWLPTYGREPEGWRNHRLMFLCWEDGTVEASECYGSIAWEETTHWMPAKKPAKPSPPSPGAAK